MQAFVFPGQGSQYPGMGRELAASYPEAREIFRLADEVLGFSLSRLCFEGPAERLQLTENTQPAILAVSIAVCRVLDKRGQHPALVAGHSLGEYSALVAAASLEFSDAVEVVRQRGRFMQEAVPVGQGAMAAVLGLDLESVEAACAEAAGDEVVSPANVNAPGQIVIAGHRRAVERAGAQATARGARRVIPLPVSAPFHCALMKPAQERLAAVLAQVPFRDFAVPLVNNVDARVIRRGEEAREGLIRQVSAPVRWTETIERGVREGVTHFVEVGPGRVLTGLIRKIAPEVETGCVETSQQVEALCSN